MAKGAEVNSAAFQPIFTDMPEFMKFNMAKKFKPIVVDMKKIPELMAKEAKGVVVNAMGVNLIMQVGRTKEQ